jgi:uncharacterized protein (DUF427 family)
MYAGACLDLPVSFSRSLRIFLQSVRLVLTGSVFAINRDRYMKKESVWNYPRPPHVEASARRVRVYFAGKPVADTRRAIRVVETSHPPVYYIPRADVRSDYLSASTRSSFCEFKGVASYWILRVDDKVSVDAAWSYEDPSTGYEAIRGCLAFYAGKVEACFLDEERVQAQPGEFYGGWVSSEIVGPFKGRPGSGNW